MFLKIRLTLLCLLLLSGCAAPYRAFTTDALPFENKITLDFSYDKVWDAVLDAFEKYPVLKADKNLGIITTDYVNTVSLQNMFYRGKGFLKKYGYFAYHLHGHDNFAVIAATEKKSPAHGNLFPGDIITNYNREKISRSSDYVFHVYREHTFRDVYLKKKRFYSSFSDVLALNGRMRFNIRLKKAGISKTVLLVNIYEEQLEAVFHGGDNVLSLGTFQSIGNDGYREMLFKHIIGWKLEDRTHAGRTVQE
jgi:hypothetical protein